MLRTLVHAWERLVEALPLVGRLPVHSPRALGLSLSISFVSASSWTATSLAQETVTEVGVVVGIVEAGEPPQPLGGATVKLEGQTATTGADGRFRFEGVPIGRRRLTAALDGYDSFPQFVEVAANQEVSSNITLIPSDGDEETITVQGRLQAASERRQLLDRLRADEVSDRVGSEEISQSGSSDAAQAAQQLPAVSIVDGKAFVRGLGDRYSQTLWNGQTLPSPEPERRVIPLDLFAASMLESVVIAKTYSPDLPAEFSGGSVQIRTKDVPEARSFKLGVSLKFRDGTTLNDFQTYEGGNTDTLTFDDGTRELPNIVPQTLVREGVSGLNTDTLQTIGRAFENVFEAHRQTAPPDHKIKASYGDSFEIGELGRIGILASVNWSNSYQNRENETRNIVANFGSDTMPDPQLRNAFTLDTSVFDAELSGMVNVTWELNRAQKIGIRNFATRTATDRVRMQEGFDQQLGEELRVLQLQWVERELLTSQLYGEHLLVGDIFVNWHASLSETERDTPDRRQIQYEFENGQFIMRNVSGSGSRDFFIQEEEVQDGAINIAIPFRPFQDDPAGVDVDQLMPPQKIQLGVSYVTRDREFQARRFRYQRNQAGPSLDEFGNPIDFTLQPESILAPDNINPDGLEIFESTRAEDQYRAKQDLQSAYLLASFRVLEWLRVQGGVRVEDSDQEVVTVDPFNAGAASTITATVDETDYSPALNLTVELPANMQIRLAGSRTVSRPEFRELSPFQFEDLAGGFSARGNENLDRSVITSYDIRWEWFPSPGEIFSISAFMKDFDDPIEKVIVPTGSSLITTWENAKEAELMGIEIEFRKRLGFLWDKLENFTLKANYAYIDSEVTTNPNSLFVQTNQSRALEGQPEYTFNAGLFYESAERGLSAGIVMNTFGESITSVGAQGAGDETEQPRISLDFLMSKKFGNSSIGLSVENILDDDFEFEQDNFTTRKYKRGVAVGISYSISF